MIDQGIEFEFELLITFGLLVALIIFNGYYLLRAFGIISKFVGFITTPIKKIYKKKDIAINKPNIITKFNLKLFKILKKDTSSKHLDDLESEKQENEALTENIDREDIVDKASNKTEKTKRKVLSSSKQTLKKFLVSIWVYKLLLINISVFPVVIFFVGDMIHSPGLIWNYPGQYENLRSYEEPLVIVFDRPINSKIVQPYIFPEIEGEWKTVAVNDWMPWSKRRLEFHPKESMFPSKVFVYYAGITDVFDYTEKWEYGIDAYSVPSADVVSVSPENNFKDYPVDGNIEIGLDIPAGRSIEWDLKVKPKAKYTVNYDDPSKIRLEFTKLLEQNTNYTFELYKIPVRYSTETGDVIERGEKELVKKTRFKTVKAPLVKSFSPKGDIVDIDSEIKVVFDDPMDQEQVQNAFTIDPKVEGKISWANKRTFIFTPRVNLSKDTTYNITFGKGIRSTIDGFTEKQLVHSFSTIGKVRVIGFFPQSSSTAVGTSINVTFDQPVDHASAQSKFSISPNSSGTFSWSGNMMVFNPNGNLGFSSTYTVTINSGVKTVKGLDSNRAFSYSFTTEPEVFILNVPVYYQQLRYSCNLVSARMALAYRGTYISTDTAYSRINKDNTPYNANNNTWGNPNSGYVGDIYGVNKGYGVYWYPLAAMINASGRGTTVKTGWNRKDALQAVKDGNPVVIWAHNGYSYAGDNISWNTSAGTYIYAISGMHSYVLKGWEGPIDNPTYIWLNDPNRGSYRVTRAYFDSLWGFFSNSAVVVH